jgi:hypothetical protein
MPVPVAIDERSSYPARLFALVRLFGEVHESGSVLVFGRRDHGSLHTAR